MFSWVGVTTGILLFKQDNWQNFLVSLLNNFWSRLCNLSFQKNDKNSGSQQQTPQSPQKNFSYTPSQVILGLFHARHEGFCSVHQSHRALPQLAQPPVLSCALSLRIKFMQDKESQYMSNHLRVNAYQQQQYIPDPTGQSLSQQKAPHVQYVEESLKFLLILYYRYLINGCVTQITKTSRKKEKCVKHIFRYAYFA